MKVLETLGRHQPTQQKGIFQYRRTQAGVQIDTTVGQAPSAQPLGIVTIPHQEWNQILDAIAVAQNNTFRIQASATGNNPQQDLNTIIQNAAPTARGNTSVTSYVAAILEHEGTVELYGGSLGQGMPAPIVLRRDP